MKAKVAIAVTLVVMAGCSGPQRMRQLGAFDGVEFEQQGGSELIRAVTIIRPSIGRPGALPACVAETVRNDSITLSDSSGSFVGAYTGNYYHSTATQQVGGGNAMEYVSPDGGVAVAKGVTTYSTSGMIPISRSVRFTVSAKPAASGMKYRFTNIEQAQINSGSAINRGYFRVASFGGANPDLVVQSLNAIAEQIDSCLR